MDPYDYFRIADTIASLTPREEINFRTSLNRIYWGAFCLVQEYHPNWVVPKKGCHEFVKKEIEDESYFGDYKDLEVYRVKADYKLKSTVTYKTYKDAKDMKDQFLVNITGEGNIAYEADPLRYYDKKEKEKKK